MKSYNFGEKSEENSHKHGGKIPVWKTPKYEIAKIKAIEMLQSDQFKGILTEADFWILMNETKTDKMAYTGLIISHNGCLKINDTLPEEKKFKPKSIIIDKDGYAGSLVFMYANDEQGIFEVGEVSGSNLKNNYPYAMALKRCFDRVVLKISKLAYSGIYSEAEADEMSKPEETKKESTDNKPKMKAGVNYKDEFLALCDQYGLNVNNYAKKYHISSKSPNEEVFWVVEDMKKEIEG